MQRTYPPGDSSAARAAMRYVRRVPTILEPAPTFRVSAVLPGGEVRELALEDFAGRWLVIAFYPRDFSTLCPVEVLELSKRAAELADLRAAVVAVSVDGVDTHRRWIAEVLGPIAVPLAADPSREMSRVYGALLEREGFAAGDLRDRSGGCAAPCVVRRSRGGEVDLRDPARDRGAASSARRWAGSGPARMSSPRRARRVAPPPPRSRRESPPALRRAYRPSRAAGGTPSAFAIFSIVSSGGDRCPRSSIET